MNNRIVFFIIFIYLTVSSCSDRDRLNPLDPLNPSTNGIPSSPSIYSIKKQVYLDWNLLSNDMALQYNLWEKTEFYHTPKLLKTLSDSLTHFVTEVSDFDTRYEFAISVVSNDGYESPRSEWKSIIPGPFNYWIIDYYQALLIKNSYDGAHTIIEKLIYFPVDLLISSSDSSVWLATNFPSQLHKLNSNGDILFTRNLFNSPTSIAYNQTTDEVYVGMMGNSELLVFNTLGDRVNTIDSNVLLSRNSDLAINSQNSYLWISVPDSNMVIKINTITGNVDSLFKNLPHPGKINIIEENETVWIGSDSGLIQFDSEDSIHIFFEENKIIDTDINHTNSEIWTIIYSGKKITWEIHVLSFHNGEWSNSLFSPLKSYNYITLIKVNPGEEHPGILIHEAYDSRLIRLDKNGNEIGWMSPFSSRLSIEIEQ